MLFDSAMELSTLGAADKSYAAGCWEKNMKNDDYLETSDYTAVSLSGSEACASISFPQRSSRLRSQFIKVRDHIPPSLEMTEMRTHGNISAPSCRVGASRCVD